MEFYFLKENQFKITSYQYKDFDNIVSNFGYLECKNDSMHEYFDWSKLDHYKFFYEVNELDVESFLMKSSFYGNENLLVRTKHHLPIIEMNPQMISKCWKALCDETSYMGWEAISTDGKYILEFTDDYQYLTISNFKIHPQSELIQARP